MHTRKEQMEAFGRFLDTFGRVAGEMPVGPQADE